VTQFELLPMPPDPQLNPVWPYWPTRLPHFVLADEFFVAIGQSRFTPSSCEDEVRNLVGQ